MIQNTLPPKRASISSLTHLPHGYNFLMAVFPQLTDWKPFSGIFRRILEDSLPVQNRQILLRFLLLPSPKNLHFFVFRKIESRLRLLRSAVAPRENPVPGKRRTAFSSSQRKRKKQRPETDTDFSPFFCCCFFPS